MRGRHGPSVHERGKKEIVLCSGGKPAHSTRYAAAPAGLGRPLGRRESGRGPHLPHARISSPERNTTALSQMATDGLPEVPEEEESGEGE
eukprot:6639165-Pyramimonas_sp.AAC.1